MEFVLSTPYAIDRSSSNSVSYPLQPYTQLNHDWTSTIDVQSRATAIAHMTEMRDWYKEEAGYATYMQAGLDFQSGWYGVDGETLLLGTEAARGEDVVSHEYSHAFIYRLYGGRLIDVNSDELSQAAAMDEGLADYFTAAKTGDTSIGEDTPFPARHVDNDSDTYTFANWESTTIPIGPPHGHGLILAGALWDMRTSGALEAAWGYPADFVEEVDRLALHALRWSVRPEDFTEYYHQLINVNNYGHGSASEPVIREIFCNRGWDTLISGCSTGKNDFIRPPESLFLDTRVHVYPNPGTSTSILAFDLAQEGDVLIDIYNVWGQRVHQIAAGRLAAGSHVLDLPISRLAAGAYFVHLKTSSSVVTVPLFVQE